MTTTTLTSTLEACCADLTHRQDVPVAPAAIDAARARGAVPFVSQCAVCGRRHYGLRVEPVKFGLTGKDL